MRRLSLALALALSLAGPVRGQPTGEIPSTDRPVGLPFSEASGRFVVSARASPTTLEAETALTYIVTVRAAGPVYRPPQRVDVRDVPAFAADFHVLESPTTPKGTPEGADGDTWEFIYRLKPRRPGVPDVPSFPFAFYDPAIRPARKAFQVIYTDPIPLRVTEQAPAAVALRVPEEAYSLATGPALLSARSPWRLPGPWALAGLLLAPPALCALGYLAYRRLRPDAALRARRRRSKAAERALRALRGRPGAEHVARTVVGYLRGQFGLPGEEPTPAEIATHLLRQGCAPELAAQAEGLFRACDEARFGTAAGEPELGEQGADFIRAVEAQPCSPGPS